MKRAFTLVELAVVLVIIGIIMGMALKGREIIEAARLRADVQRVAKLQVAFAILRAKGLSLPKVNVGIYVYYDYSMFVDLGLLGPGDLYLRSITTGTAPKFKGGNISLFACTRWRTTDHAGLLGIPGLPPYDQPADGICLSVGSTKGYFACSIEQILDDNSFISGYGTAYTFPAKTFDQLCSQINQTEKLPTYAYLFE